MAKTYVYSGVNPNVVLELDRSISKSVVISLIKDHPDIPLGYYVSRDEKMLRRTSLGLDGAIIVHSVEAFLKELD